MQTNRPTNTTIFLRQIVYLFVFQLLAFAGYRVLHFFVNYQPVTAGYADAFVMGFRFDLSVAAYLSVLPFLLFSIEYFFGRTFKPARRIVLLVFYVLVFFSHLVFAASIPFFSQFETFLNQSVFLYTGETAYVFSLIFGDVSYWGFLVVLALVYAATVFALARSLRPLQASGENNSLAKNTAVFFAAAAVVFVSIRGRVSLKAPLHPGLALVSNNNFTNTLATNPNFPFWKGMLSGGSQYKPPGNLDQLFAETKNYLGAGTEGQSLDRPAPATGANNQYNVVLLLMESLSRLKMGHFGGTKTYTRLDSTVRESVFFENFYSSGIHTFNGIFSTISSFPAVPGEQGLRYYIGQPFSNGFSALKQKGYRFNFYTTHDRHFDNMAGFLKLNGFDEIVDDSEISENSAINNLGVPDHVLFDEFITRHRKQQQPFFSLLLSASDHGPWDVPQGVGFNPPFDDKQQNAGAYADWALRRFLNKAKKEAWYQHTIFLILGDHGSPSGHTYEMPLSYHHIPLIVHCPSLLKPDTLFQLGYQPDVVPTILSMLNVSYINSGFGQNLLQSQRGFVFFTADDKAGLVTADNYYFVKFLKQQKRGLYRFRALDSTNLAYTRATLADSLEKKLDALLLTSGFLLHRDYYLR